MHEASSSDNVCILIESQWNLNAALQSLAVLHLLILIESQWNLNQFAHIVFV